MPISFFAVQCFNCSTMQVKQEKKSNRKWSCVVCNHKQSVRKVFARSFMAKDVRFFVQNFNMSRRFSDHPDDHDTPVVLESPKSEEPKRKRNDWTEYIDDDQDENCAKFERLRKDSVQGDDEVEAEVVTEMPTAMFGKPRARDYSCRPEKKLYKPSFPNRRDDQRHQHANSQDLERYSDKGMKWNSFMAQIKGTRDLAMAEKPKHQKMVGKNSVSKWRSFITEDDADDNDANDNDDYQNTDIREENEDETVEEDIHPDFL